MPKRKNTKLSAAERKNLRLRPDGTPKRKYTRRTKATTELSGRSHRESHIETLPHSGSVIVTFQHVTPALLGRDESAQYLALEVEEFDRRVETGDIREPLTKTGWAVSDLDEYVLTLKRQRDDVAVNTEQHENAVNGPVVLVELIDKINLAINGSMSPDTAWESVLSDYPMLASQIMVYQNVDAMANELHILADSIDCSETTRQTIAELADKMSGPKRGWAEQFLSAARGYHTKAKPASQPAEASA